MVNTDNKENEPPNMEKAHMDSSNALYRVQRPLQRRPLQELSIELVKPSQTITVKKSKKSTNSSSYFAQLHAASGQNPPPSVHSSHKQPSKARSPNPLLSMR
ncbi:meiotic APC inhibitor Mes1 [Schizosaccharomyces pombe]|uniref:Protein mes1 n=1 Tax=Schizosaccharomyces pombe (strain 972 / ATCC 24843) TaxID=284812 RepID=MES1_SCHPO|nr:protein Mes1 [Schizosaccharomyces pombe]P41005.1 RecName: Full=Protein mes1 [Schizosaccharomyces pombe 972h-]BAA05027.1 mes1 protein [Schizosaccharomyces pombe]CAB10856.1 meiosis II protein Mes1 [Schizosaccharomyces pombe]|eukprot:NP_593361.1 protein Mes1 [Schizosaccharomyces pombe]